MYSFKSTIRYSETNKQNMLTAYSMVNYMQDCSTFQSEKVGLGVARLKEVQKVWVVNSWQIEIRNPDKLKAFSDIEIGTWPYDKKGPMAYRNFYIADENGEKLVCANSIWALLDTNTLRPMRIQEEDIAAYGTFEKLDMKYSDRKIAYGDSLTSCEPIEVQRFHLDSNNHVNNAKYFLMAEGCIPEGEYPVYLRAEYRKSAVLGDVVYPFIEKNDLGYVIVLGDKEANPYAIIEWRIR